MKVLILDSSYLMYKSYFAFAKNHLTVTRDGKEIITSAIFGFINEIINLYSEMRYDFILAAHDKGPYIKKQKYPSYKENRKNNLPDFYSEKEIIKAILYDLNIPSIESPGYEGEEVANHIIKSFNNKHKIHFFTNDEDCYVLLKDNVTLIKTIKGEINMFTLDDLMEKYKVTPKQFRHWKALTGCSTDKVEGVNGIGKKNATDLISKYHSIKNVLKHIDDISPNLKEKIQKAIKKGTLKSSIYLTKIQNPETITFYEPEIELTYMDIMEFIDARSFMKGEKKLLLKGIQKKQKENEKWLPKNLIYKKRKRQ